MESLLIGNLKGLITYISIRSHITKKTHEREEKMFYWLKIKIFFLSSKSFKIQIHSTIIGVDPHLTLNLCSFSYTFVLLVCYFDLLSFI
jgi:hypothetical protein